MKFNDWKLLKENLTSAVLKQRGEVIKKELNKDFGNLYVIPDFDTFEREGEPVQQNVLFTNKGVTDSTDKTFGFNYTGKGDLYSVDFWKGLKPDPAVTMYVHNTSIEDVYKLVPEITKDPKPNLDLKNMLVSKKGSLTEADDEIDAEVTDSKPIKNLDPAVKAAEKDLYDYSDPETIFEDLATYVDMVIKGTQPSLLVTGSPGVGKTYLITRQLKDHGLKPGEDYLHVKGRSTAVGMYITLYENNGKIIVFDDCDSIFGSADAVNVLKGALDSTEPREISWLSGRPIKATDGSNVPKQFRFTGRVIFISNLPQKKLDDAIKSRSFVLEVALTPEDMLKKMRKEIKNVSPEVPLPLREEALEFIEEVSKTAKNLELNMRTLVKAIKILKDVNNLDVAERLIMQQCSYK